MNSTTIPSRPIRGLLALALALGLSQPAAQAAAITWGSAQDDTDLASDVKTNGTFVDAVTTYGNGSGADVTLNGVTFKHYSSSSGSTLSFGTSRISMTYPTTNLNFTGNNATTDYQKLRHNSMYAQNGSGTITLSNLTSGNNYQVQVWAPDWNGPVSDVFDGQVTILGRNYSAGNHSQYAVGTFTADGTGQQVINFVAGATGGYYSFAPTAVSLRDVTPIPAIAANSTVTASPTTVASDGVTTSTITVTLKGAGNAAAWGKTVTLASSRSATDTISPATGVSNDSGVVTLSVKSTTAGTAVFTATDVTDSNLVIAPSTASVTFSATVVSAATSTATASPATVTADGSSTSTITVTLKNAVSAPISGKAVTLAKTSGPGSPVITPIAGTTDGSGVATFTVKSTTAGSPVFTATGDSVALNQTATVTFTAGAVNAGTSTVVAAPATVPADGSATSTVTVTLLDANSNPVAGKTVTLAHTSGPGTPVITTVSGTTSASGVATFTVKSGSPGVDVFTATGDGVTLTPTATVTFTAVTAIITGGSTMLNLDYAQYLAPIDLHFTQPTQAIKGIPLGNGKMGTLVWIDGTGSMLQFNFGRPDVFYRGSATATFSSNFSNASRTDGNSKVGHVDIGFSGTPFASTCKQDLHTYDGYESVEGVGVSARIVPWRDHDVFAIEITDTRATPTAITVNLKKILPDDLVLGLYQRTSTLSQQGNMLVLKQVFSEACDTGMTVNDFYCASGMVVAVQGRTATATTDLLTVPAANGTFTIYISSAASMEPAVDVTALASAEMNAALATTFPAIYDSNVSQWHDFWKRSFIYLPSKHDLSFPDSPDQHWLYYLYCMNTCQRGQFPVNANGAIFNVQDGWQYWGSMYWWFNSSRQTLTPVFEQANHPELADPYFAMLTRQFPRINTVASQYFGCGKDAIWVQETFAFDGPEVMPASGPMPTSATRSDWETRWTGGTCSRLLYNTAEAAQWYWERYEYTHDIAWLRDRAYPMLKGAAELYRTFPGTQLEADGKYHINNTSWAETYLNGVRDGINDLASVKGIFPVAIQAAQLLNVDADLVPLWQDMLTNLAPYPTNATPNAMGVLQVGNEPVFAIGIGSNTLIGSAHDPRMLMVSIFDLVNSESKLTNPTEWQIAANTLAAGTFGQQVLNSVTPFDASICRFPGEVARLGRADWVEQCFRICPSWWNTVINDYPNRIREYNVDPRFAIDFQTEATISEGLTTALLQSGAAAPGGTPIIRVFPAWPTDTDAAFSLRAKGGFLVTSQMKSGNVGFVEITSSLGGPCTMRNYWGAQSVDLYRNGLKSATLSAELLTFATAAGENIVIVKQDANLNALKENLAATVPDSASNSTVVAVPSAVLADGSATSTITVTLNDANNNPIAGKSVTLAQTAGPGSPVITTVNGTSNSSRIATFTVTSTTTGTDVFTATDVSDGFTVNQSAGVTFMVVGPIVSAANSTLVAAPSSVLADGVATATLTVTLKDSNNNVVAGKAVTLAKTSGPGSPVIATLAGTTDSAGLATFTVKSTTIGTDVFTATDVTDGVTVNQTASVTFTAAGTAVSASNSTVVAAPSSVLADGSATSTLTVTLKDAGNNLVAGKTVTLAKTSGSGSPVITTIFGTTDSSGNATFTVTSTTTGTDVFTATDASDGIALTQTASVTFIAQGASSISQTNATGAMAGFTVSATDLVNQGQATLSSATRSHAPLHGTAGDFGGYDPNNTGLNVPYANDGQIGGFCSSGSSGSAPWG
ncbi:MAG: invasin domain 3-containing protein, partial [Verrucomicrobiota bacterium]